MAPHRILSILLLSLLICSSAYSAQRATLQRGDGTEVGTAANPIYVSGGGSGTPGGSDTQVQFNDGGSAFGGDAGMVFNKTTNVLTVSGDVIVGTQSVCQEDGTNCPAAGAGDVLSVSDCLDGACYDGTSDGGTYARLYDGDSNYTAIVSSNVAANKTITLPPDTATLSTLALAETLTNKTLAAADNVIEADDVSCTNCLTVTEVASADAATNVSDADFGDVTVATGAWAVEDNSHNHDATTLSTDSVSADELNATGVEAELESALDIAGEISSTGMASTVIADSITVTGWVMGASTATTPAADDNDTSLATTAYVQTELIRTERLEWSVASMLPLEAADSIPPISKDAGTNLDMLPVDFDDAADECRQVYFTAPPRIQSGGTVTFGIRWYSAAATSGDAIWDARHNSGTAADIDPDVALTTEAASADTTAGTAGMLNTTTWTETVTNLAWVAEDFVVCLACRDANAAGDTLVGDARAVTFYVDIPVTS